MASPLKQFLLDRIRAHGPMSIADYMFFALYSDHGYYNRRDPFGVRGDFITAPEVSQIFGELIGAFLIHAWEDRGRPKAIHLVELGPGRGTLMADILRTARVRAEFAEAAHVTLVEISPALREAQRKTLGANGSVTWADKLEDLPADAPLFLVANEFFDALPIDQHVKTEKGWQERRVGADGNRLVFTLDSRINPNLPADAPAGSVYESSLVARGFASAVAERVAAQGGIALIVDYGHPVSGYGDTFQAVKNHARADPLAEPGEADLTTHVDFDILAKLARARGAHPHGPVTQKAFLESLGIQARAEALSRAAPNEAADIRAAVARLTGADQMGTLFKVLAISDSATPPAGFP